MNFLTSKRYPSQILKIALFATGLSGIVAEYILSTLATYFIGDSVKQWTLILSVMLFSMGLGSRVSQYFEKNLLEKFILCEFLLSILVSFCALATYTFAIYIDWIEPIIYSFSIVIGMLIGLEIPLVTRLNDQYEDLRLNISSVMEKDYFGSLVGGVFFAYVGLPYLGLTYTPFILGSINFLVAVLVYIQLENMIETSQKKLFQILLVATFTLITAGLFAANPIILYGEQQRYRDKIVFEQQTQYQKIVVTQYKNHYALYLSTHLQFNSFDEWLYHEPLVHPLLNLVRHPQDVLILGGGDGCAVREVLKYETVKSITLVDLDPAMTDLGKNNPIFREINQDALHNKKVKIYNKDAFNFLADSLSFYDAIIIDFPDPKTIELNRLYTLEFYKLCYQHLRPQGFLITQAGSPYFATRAFKSIEKTIASAGFGTLPLHNQVITMGQWGYVIGAKGLNSQNLKTALRQMPLAPIEYRWLNREALLHISAFGKDFVPSDEVEINTLHNPVLYKYYNAGNWDMY
ncbi:polyamine aminopropyltransferase [Hugenholtzia roseola]|uniref:polyamine aminopropyltransferase n=1 Tax=Hugenholtzia roseola TaxID=1002 RepID=UPI000403547C|nr:polyamine aminopropyltransferase [Hugenholtzia roseola]